MDLSRRDFFKLSAAGSLTGTAIGGVAGLGAWLRPSPRRRRSGSRRPRPPRACAPTARWAAPAWFTPAAMY